MRKVRESSLCVAMLRVLHLCFVQNEQYGPCSGKSFNPMLLNVINVRYMTHV
jgi:hypothetical protein